MFRPRVPLAPRVAPLLPALLIAAGSPASAAPSRLSRDAPKKMNTFSPRFSFCASRVSYEFVVPAKDHKGVTICAAGGAGCKDVVPDAGPSAAGFDDEAPPPVRELAWHPDPKRAYVYGSTGGKSTINIYMEGEGCLTCEKAFGFGNKIHPTWSPDGRWLAFAVQDPGTEHGEIYLLNVYELEKGPKAVTKHEDDTSYQPRFSPDGKKLLFSRFNPERSDNDLYILDDFQDPKSLRKLTKLPGGEMNASWSPDGSKVAFFYVWLKKGKAATDLYVTASDGSGQPTLLASDVVKPDRSDPLWTKDGARLIFVKDDEKASNPVSWLSVADPKSKGIIDTGTIQNDDVASSFTQDGKIRLLWTAQGTKTDKEKTWRKVYGDEVSLP